MTVSDQELRESVVAHAAWSAEHPGYFEDAEAERCAAAQEL